MLKRIVGDEELYEQYLLEMLLAHPGWAGMVRVIEQNRKRCSHRREISLKELLAWNWPLNWLFCTRKKAPNFQALRRCPIQAEPRCSRTAASSRNPVASKGLARSHGNGRCIVSYYWR